jgi:hypothetical protein
LTATTESISKQKSGTAKSISPTSTGGVFIHLSPLKTMNAFREKALWENNQRLLSQKDILKRQLAEVKETRKNIAELEAMRTAIREAK